MGKVVKYKIGVCQSYAMLFNKMAEVAKLDVDVVVGDANGGSGKCSIKLIL